MNDMAMSHPLSKWLVILMLSALPWATGASAQIVKGKGGKGPKCKCEEVDPDARTLAKYEREDDDQFKFEKGILGDVISFPFIGLDSDGEINEFEWTSPAFVDFMIVKYSGTCDVVNESADKTGADNNPGGEPGTADGEGTEGRFGPTDRHAVSNFSLCKKGSSDPCAGNQLPHLSSLGAIQGSGTGSAFRDVTFSDADGGLTEIQFLTLQNIDVTSLDGNWVEGPAGTWTPTVSTSTATFRFSQQAGNTDKAIFEALVSDGCGQINIDPAMSWSGAANAAVAAGSETPGAFRLGDNYPNPFNPTTTVRFEVAEQAQVRVAVYDVLGRLVKTLATGEMLPGTYTATWDGTSEAGTAVSSGVYLYRMEAGSYVATKVMSLLK